MTQGPTSDELRLIDAWWRAANYLTVGQIYLQDNPLLREPLRPEHIKPRLLGHWGTSPGAQPPLRAPQPRDPARRARTCSSLPGPGHGGPAVVANVYLEGTYSEVYPRRVARRGGHARLFRQFSTPGGIPSHVGRADARLDPRRRRARLRARRTRSALCSTTRTSSPWRRRRRRGGDRAARGLVEGHQLPEPGARRRRAADPAPERLQDLRPDRARARRPTRAIRELLHGHGYEVRGSSRETTRMAVHQALAATLDACCATIRAIQRRRAPASGVTKRPRWPAIVLRTPKGWTGPEGVDGLPVEGTFRAHQVPLAEVRTNPAHLAMLEAWMRATAREALRRRGTARSPSSPRWRRRASARMGANPHANGGTLAVPLDLVPTSRATRSPSPTRRPSGTSRRGSLGSMLRDVYAKNPTQLPPLLPRRDELEPPRRRLRGREPLLAGADDPDPTTTSRPTGASWRC